MSIRKINSNDSTSNKIEDINDMVIEVDGKIDQGKFDKNEIDHLYSVLWTDRKFLRNQSLGHTLTTYSGWSHVQAESGYSIWKYSPTNYTYNAYNELYLDNKVLENRGQANSETLATFLYVYLYNGSTYTDNSVEAATESGTAFSLMDASGEYLYVGSSSTYAGVSFEFATRGSNYTLHVEYYNGATWTELDISACVFTDDTSNWESDGRIYWDIPSNWNTTTVNSASAYWVRFSTTTTPTTTATAYLIVPANTVTSILKLSSEEVLNEDWAWCTYGTALYVTIRNAGVAAYEGDAYITSSSSSINKQNFFIANHEYTANYQDSTYDAVITKTTDYVITGNEGVIIVDASAGNITITLPRASANEGKRIVIKAATVGSAYAITIDGESAETIDGASSYTLDDNYEYVEVVSNGLTWYIIGRYP